MIETLIAGCALGVALFVYGRFAYMTGRKHALKGMHSDLGKLKWMGADDGWDCAVEAVRKELLQKMQPPIRRV